MNAHECPHVPGGQFVIITEQFSFVCFVCDCVCLCFFFLYRRKYVIVRKGKKTELLTEQAKEESDMMVNR